MINKKLIVSELKTGDILKARMHKYPFIFHYGIILISDNQINVVHNTPDNKNNYGGNILVDNLNKWLNTRKLVSIQRTNIPKERILLVAKQNRSRPFNLLTFNCEHFVFEIRDGSPSSPQIRQWLYNIVSFLFIMNQIINKKVLSSRII